MSQTSHKRQKAGSIPATATKDQEPLEAPSSLPRMIISEYTYGDDHDPTKSIIQIRVKYRGNGLWAVYDSELRTTFNTDGNWETEPAPSNRTPAYLERNRFELIDALAAARRAYSELRENDRSNRIQELPENGDSEQSNEAGD